MSADPRPSLAAQAQPERAQASEIADDPAFFAGEWVRADVVEAGLRAAVEPVQKQLEASELEACQLQMRAIAAEAQRDAALSAQRGLEKALLGALEDTAVQLDRAEKAEAQLTAALSASRRLHEQITAQAQTITRLREGLENLDAIACPRGQQVVINGDRWEGQLVVKLADVLALLSGDPATPRTTKENEEDDHARGGRQP